MKHPIDLLPIPFPASYDPGPDYFYENVVKPLIPDTIRIMSNGIHLDYKAAAELGKVIDNVLKNVSETLAVNKVIQEFQEQEYPKVFAEYKKEVEASMRDIEFYTKDYNPKNAVHRTYVANQFIEYVLKKPTECRVLWSAADLKKAGEYYNHPVLNAVITKTIDVKCDLILSSMNRLAQDKLDIWNKPRLTKIAEATKESLIPPFNPGSSLQLTKLFEYLEIEPLAFSKKTKLASWGRDQIEEVMLTETDPDRLEMLQMFVDYSFSNIIKTNFLEAFDTFGIEEILHGNLKLFGAKTVRYTSNSPNLNNKV